MLWYTAFIGIGMSIFSSLISLAQSVSHSLIDDCKQAGIVCSRAHFVGLAWKARIERMHIHICMHVRMRVHICDAHRAAIPCTSHTDNWRNNILSEVSERNTKPKKGTMAVRLSSMKKIKCVEINCLQSGKQKIK